ncbi:PD-(D/E)XK nuclease family protein [Serinibacter salmoneus]|uniref:PD-(D/E)XK nuclease superfamily protein n=1 Tax=Serinibacter salmoneus TaxID=556530 RepID=A0A2A9CWJ7_9MICO|nr:PD-(D/E)XK nuclease family protein [Serinibacter salmoneus]PFG18511.1 PD-(D/E)XK nuclease superfamily protein [Serinibacter salmoneus]
MNRLITAGFGAPALQALRRAVEHAKHGDPLAPVTILCPDNIAAVAARRALAHGIGGRPGVAAIDVTTTRRLAEHLVQATGATTRPVTSALLTALWRRELERAPGVFAPVIDRPATVRALVRAHHELRDAPAVALRAVAEGSHLGADLVRLHRAVLAALVSDGRQDAAAILEAAAAHLPDGAAHLGPVILHLPGEPEATEATFLRALAAATPLTAILGTTGNPAVDAPATAAFTTILGVEADPPGATTPHPTEPIAGAVVHTSDSDEEVREALRRTRRLLAAGTPAHRIALLYPVAAPYARLLHDHLAAAGIAANGPGVRPLRDRAIADAFLALLALDPERLDRIAVFDWFGRAPILHGAAARVVPRTAWDRIAREAGVTRGTWAPRLADHTERLTGILAATREDPEASEATIAHHERALAAAQDLAAFITELTETLRAGREATTWADLGAWAARTFARYLGAAASARMTRLPQDEQRAATAIETTLGGLGELDAIAAGPPSVADLAEILAVDLDGHRPRVGRFGEGVFVGPIGAATSLETDHTIVLGLAEDLYPGRHRVDPLLPDAVRRSAGLRTDADRLRERHRALLAALACAPEVTATFPRGDLRRGAERLPSRWLMPTLRALTRTPDLQATGWSEASSDRLHAVASHWEGVARGADPGSEQEWRLRRITGGDPLHDGRLAAALELLAARAEESFTRFDGNVAGVAGLPDFTAGDRAIAPTTLERYAGCPHAYFQERLLNVRPLEEPEEILTLSPADLGTIIHEVMDRLTSEAKAAGTLPGFGEPWSAAHRRRMGEIAGEVMDAVERRGLTGHPRLWERERELILGDLTAVLDLDDAAHATQRSRLIASELAFGQRGLAPVQVPIEMPDGAAHLAMRGSADRVEETSEGRLIVTDLKTGSSRTFKDIAQDPVVAGTKLQLPAYAMAAQREFGHEGQEIEAAYWFVGRKYHDERVEVRLDEDLASRYARALGALVAGIRDGQFIPRPPQEDDFSWVKCPYCNPDGVGYGHVRTGAYRKRTDPALADLFALLDPGALAEGSDLG